MPQLIRNVGIFVDATQLGIQIQRINPMTSRLLLWNIVAVGDIIIGIDDVDVVGVESGIFWPACIPKLFKIEFGLFIYRMVDTIQHMYIICVFVGSLSRLLDPFSLKKWRC